MVQFWRRALCRVIFGGPPIRLAAGQKSCLERSPMLGEHNDYVYRELLGLTGSEVEELIKSHGSSKEYRRCHE